MRRLVASGCTINWRRLRILVSAANAEIYQATTMHLSFPVIFPHTHAVVEQCVGFLVNLLTDCLSFSTTPKKILLACRFYQLRVWL